MKSTITFLAASLALISATANADTYNPANQQLSITSALAGNTRYTNAVVVIDGVVSVGGGAAVGNYDIYDANTNRLAIPSVTVANVTYTNVIATIKSVVSSGTAGGTYDTYNSAANLLTIPSVIVGTATYTNVSATIKSVLKVNGGTPNGTQDTYDATSNQLAIPLVLADNMVYSNVTVTVGNVLSYGGKTDTGTPNNAALSKLCPTSLSNGGYSNCKGTGDSTTNDVLLPVSNQFNALNGATGTITFGNRTDIAIGSKCTFGLEPFIPLFISTVNGKQQALSFTGIEADQIYTDSSGIIGGVIVGDETKGPAFEINIVDGGLEVVLWDKSNYAVCKFK